MDEIVIPPMPDAVAAVFAGLPGPVATHLRAVRAELFRLAAQTPGVGPLTETLKWGEPAYLTAESGSGTTIRLGRPKGSATAAAVYFNCRTTLLDAFRERFPTELRYDGDRAILLDTGAPLPREALGTCLVMALTYHSARRRRR